MSSDINNIQLIAGLGNPGNEYEKTRHNAGFWFIEHFASQHNLTLKKEAKFLGLFKLQKRYKLKLTEENNVVYQHSWHNFLWTEDTIPIDDVVEVI